MKHKPYFRAKRRDNGEWVYGFYTTHLDFKYGEPFTPIIQLEENYTKHIEVIEKTRGQFTGKTDKNGVKIFEDDIVVRHDLTFDLSHTYIVAFDWDTASFVLTKDKKTSIRFVDEEVYDDGHWSALVEYEYEVIGNVFDNPELAEKFECIKQSQQLAQMVEEAFEEAIIDEKTYSMKCHICNKPLEEKDAIKIGHKSDPEPKYLCKECWKPIDKAFSQSTREEAALVNLINEQMAQIKCQQKEVKND